MTARKEPLWTIAELSAEVAVVLSVDYPGPPNGKVRPVPDLRTIRYYTTLGLLDRPAQMQGRTALYSRKHLLQLVAIKRLQARGLSLQEVQQQLLGLPERKLQRIAQLPGNLEPLSVDANPESNATAPRRSEAFWSIAPTPAPQEASEITDGEAAAPAAVPLQGVGVSEGVTLLLAAERPLADDDISALRAVAAPLLQLLHK